MRITAGGPAHAKNNRPASANTAGYDRNSHPLRSATDRWRSQHSARWCRGRTELSNRLGPCTFSAAHRGKEQKVGSTRALRAAVLSAGQSLKWRSPPGRRHTGLGSHARNYATRRMWSCEAVFGQEQCQDEGGELVLAFSFGKGSPASPAYACARTNTEMGTSMHLAEQRPNPSFKRTCLRQAA